MTGEAYVRDLHGTNTDGHLPGDDGLTLCRFPVGRSVISTRYAPVQPCPTCARVAREGTSRQRTVLGRVC